MFGFSVSNPFCGIEEQAGILYEQPWVASGVGVNKQMEYFQSRGTFFGHFCTKGTTGPTIGRARWGSP